jgi:hypothetical protein
MIPNADVGMRNKSKNKPSKKSIAAPLIPAISQDRETDNGSEITEYNKMSAKRKHPVRASIFKNRLEEIGGLPLLRRTSAMELTS